MTTTPFPTDTKIRFKVQGQQALPKWQRDAIKRGLESEAGPPESLRFQCRIATDAIENLQDVELSDGSRLKLHHKARPQFGKNRDGLPYLTATLVHDVTGDSFRVQWVGEAVPIAMQRTAVAHDEGRKVPRRVIALDLSEATITPSHRTRHGSRVHRKDRDPKAEKARRRELRAQGIAPRRRRSRRTCGRLTADDVA